MLRFFHKIPLRVTLVVPFVLQLMIVAGLIGFLSWQSSSKAVKEVASQLREEITAKVSGHLSNFLSQPHLTNRLTSNALLSGNLKIEDSMERETYFWGLLRSFDALNNTFFGTPLGDLYGARRIKGKLELTLKDAETGGALNYYASNEIGRRAELIEQIPGYAAQQRPWFQSAIQKGRAGWSGVYADVSGRGLAITAVEPIYKENRLQGVVGSALLLTGIESFLNSLKVGKTGQVFIIEPSGLLLATSKGDLLVSDGYNLPSHRITAHESNNPLVVSTAQFLEERFGDLIAIEKTYQLDFTFQGEKQFLQVTPLNDEWGLRLLVVVVVPQADFLGDITANLHLTLWLVGIALFLALGAGLLTSQWITKPLLHLNKSAKELALGRWEKHECIPLAREDEVGQLSHSFCSMAEQLKEYFLTLEDKVERRTRDIAEKNVQLERLNQDKNEFLGIAAHDLKNPLSAIKGLSEEISEYGSDMDRKEIIDYAKKIQRASHKIFQLIITLLDVNAIEAGKMNIEPKIGDLLPIVKAVVEDYQSRAEVKQIQLYFESEQRPYLSWIDNNVAHQILENLISNAVKYSPFGRQAWVRLREEQDLIYCEVQDQGPGLSVEDQQKLFGKFTRLSPRPTGDEHSTGLGLFIVKKLAETMHAKIGCHSEQGKGSTFFVAFRKDAV
ncbi:MAG: hypothetical protein RIT27_1340 [Pseudomonadota bacterium]|jgi:signal transduction histidine kinase